MPSRSAQKHICSDMAAWLRVQFPRLTTAQIDRLARVIRRKQGRPSFARITGLTIVTFITTTTQPLTRDDWDQMRDRLRGAK